MSGLCFSIYGLLVKNKKAGERPAVENSEATTGLFADCLMCLCWDIKNRKTVCFSVLRLFCWRLCP
jgi:hypothetical protein